MIQTAWERGLALARWRSGWGCTLLVGVLAGIVRLWELGRPRGRIFDEVYYACDAQNLLRFGVEVGSLPTDGATPSPPCTPSGEAGFVVHPPLGKWAIAAGMRVLGVNELGWRIAAAAAGIIGVVLLVRITQRLTGQLWVGAVAGVLCGLDGLHLVQSRVAMLDIFLSTWVLAGLLCLLRDRDVMRRRVGAGERATARAAERDGLDEAPPDEDVGVPLSALGWRGVRWWRIAAGVCLGGACATKWSGVYYLAAGGLGAVGWELHARAQARGWARGVGETLRGVPGAVVQLVVLPSALYIASWAGWFRSEMGWSRSWAAGRDTAWGLIPDSLRSLWHYHGEMLEFHQGLASPHNYQSHPLGWLLLDRPVSYYYEASPAIECAAKACSAEVLAIGLPSIWWASVLALLVCFVRVIRSLEEVALVALVGAACAILVWVPADLNDRTMFSFYVLPGVPFMCLAIAACCAWAVGGTGAGRGRRRGGLLVVGGYLLVVVVSFLYFYPVLTGVTLSYDAWRDRMWFESWI